MNASQVIDEIVSLPPADQAQVIHFAARLEAQQRLTGEELTALAERLAGATRPKEASALRDEIVRGFYGRTTDA